MFKTETHLHVSEVSRCSHLTAEEMIKLYAEAGYSTVFVTDHFNPAYFEDDSRGRTREERVNWFMGGYEAAKTAGDKLGVDVIFAMEMHLRSTHNHYLLYGIDRAFLLEVYGMFDKKPQDVYELTRKHGVAMVQAHPYRDGNCHPTPRCVDAMEVINPNPRHENFDKKAIETAKSFKLPITSGSDAHRPEDVARGGVMTKKKIRTTEDYLKALFDNKLVLIGGEKQ